MTIHVNFIEHRKTKYGCIDYTFIDRHTSEEIAFGSYNGAKGFEVIDLRTAGVNTYVNAAVAWTTLNRMLTDEYGY
jgi:hypothetical protein